MTDEWSDSDEEMLRNAVTRAVNLEVENNELKDAMAALEQERDDLLLKIEHIEKGVDEAIDSLVKDIDKAIRV